MDVTARVPDAVTDLVAAAALANDGATAMDLFEAARVRAGQQVLVVGATGGTGALLVQLARNAGARAADAHAAIESRAVTGKTILLP